MRVVLFVLLVAAQAVVVERMGSLDGSGYVRRPLTVRSRRIELAIALQHPVVGAEKLKRRLDEIADPDHADYGSWLTKAQVDAYLDPSEREWRRVTQWVQLVDPTARLRRGQRFLFAQLAVADAERLLQCRFALYEHEQLAAPLIRAEHYSVPAELADAVGYVGNVVHLPRVRAAPRVSAPADGGVLSTPQTLWAQLNISREADVPTAPSGRNLQAVASFLGQYYEPSDLAQMREQFDLPPQTVEKSIGPNGVRAGVEASLDVQYLMGVASGVRTWVWSTPGEHGDGNEPLIVWLDNVTRSEVQPLVWSISYQDLEPTLGVPYMRHVDTEFAGLVARGVTLHSGGGDWGTQCSSSCDRFVSDFTSASPYMLSAGWLEWADCPTCTADASAVPLSSGGFSDVFPRPSYQEQAVKQFLERTKVDPSFFNASGRAFPDWSTAGVLFQVVVNGSVTDVAGASAATPTTASFTSLLNEARLKAGKPSMGWLHPFLYKAWAEVPGAFIDITKGNNQFGCCSEGFDAVPGFDAITGLGVPQFQVFRKLALEGFPKK